MKVYESNFLRLDFSDKDKLVEITWLPDTSNMLEDDYKREFTNYLEFIMKVHPKKVIADNKTMFFPISPELQEWTNETIFPPSLEMGLNKAAFVMSPEFVAQLSIEQTMEEGEGMKFITQYFDDKTKAKEWILGLPLE